MFSGTVNSLSNQHTYTACIPTKLILLLKPWGPSECYPYYETLKNMGENMFGTEVTETLWTGSKSYQIPHHGY